MFIQPCEMDCACEYAAKGEGSWVEGGRAGGVETVEEAGLGEEARRFDFEVGSLWALSRCGKSIVRIGFSATVRVCGETASICRKAGMVRLVLCDGIGQLSRSRYRAYPGRR